MRYARTLINTLATLFILTTCASLAHAQTAQRTFVSTSGNDANTASLCGRNTPCRGFTAAISVVTAGGEVVALDSGGYGAFAISKSVSVISAPGVYAGVTAASGNGIDVTAAGATVIIKGLTINRQGTGSNGISVTAVGTLHIEDCTVNGFSGRGISVTLSADGSYIFIKNTLVRNNADDGIIVTTSTGLVRAFVERCRAVRNGSGFFASDNSRVNISNSVASNNNSVGFLVSKNSSTATAQMSAESCVASYNAFGFYATASSSGGTPSVMSVARSTATNNVNGFTQLNSSVFRVLANTNLLGGNGTDKNGIINPVAADAP